MLWIDNFSGLVQLFDVNHLTHMDMDRSEFCGQIPRQAWTTDMTTSLNLPTVDGRNPAPPGMVLKPCKSWDKLPFPQLVRRISEPSTVSLIQSWTSMLVTCHRWSESVDYFHKTPGLAVGKRNNKNTGNRNDMRFTYTYKRHLLLPLTVDGRYL